MLTSRRATVDDAAFLLLLRNDPATVAASRTAAIISSAEHAQWLTATLASSIRILMIVERREWDEDVIHGGEEQVERVATYRLDRVGSYQVEVSLTIAPEHRGHGLAAQVIRLASQDAMRRGAASVVAIARRDNTRSLRAFLSAGFRLSPPSTDDESLLLLGAQPEDVAAQVCRLCRDGVAHHTNAKESIGGSENRGPRYDLHVSTGGGLEECVAGDLWLAWERGMRQRSEEYRRSGRNSEFHP